MILTRATIRHLCLAWALLASSTSSVVAVLGREGLLLLLWEVAVALSREQSRTEEEGRREEEGRGAEDG